MIVFLLLPISEAELERSRKLEANDRKCEIMNHVHFTASVLNYFGCALWFSDIHEDNFYTSLDQ